MGEPRAPAEALQEITDGILMLVPPDSAQKEGTAFLKYARALQGAVPVCIASACLEEPRFEVDEPDSNGIQEIRLWKSYGRIQSGLLNEALLDVGIIRPQLWIQDPSFWDFVRDRHSPLKVFLVPNGADSNEAFVGPTTQGLRGVLNHVDLTVFSGKRPRWADSYQGCLHELVSPDFAETLVELLSEFYREQITSRRPRNVLILYDHHRLGETMGRETLEGLQAWSTNRLFFLSTSDQIQRSVPDLDPFDVIIVHHSVKDWAADTPLPTAMMQYGGGKAYLSDGSGIISEGLLSLLSDIGIHCIFTGGDGGSLSAGPCKSDVVSIPNACVPLKLEEEKLIRSVSRPITLVARWNNAGPEESDVLQELRKTCDSRGVSADLLFGHQESTMPADWYLLLRNSVALLTDPIHDRWPSQPVIDAIAIGTVLLYFDDQETGPLRNGESCLVLRRDLSNFDDVITKLADEKYALSLAALAGQMALGGNEHNGQHLAETVDTYIRKTFRARAGRPLPFFREMGMESWGSEYPAEALSALSVERRVTTHLLSNESRPRNSDLVTLVSGICREAGLTDAALIKHLYPVLSSERAQELLQAFTLSEKVPLLQEILSSEISSSDSPDLPDEKWRGVAQLLLPRVNRKWCEFAGINRGALMKRIFLDDCLSLTDVADLLSGLSFSEKALLLHALVRSPEFSSYEHLSTLSELVEMPHSNRLAARDKFLHAILPGSILKRFLFASFRRCLHRTASVLNYLRHLSP